MSDAKMLQYLAVIERRTNEILQMYDACQGKVLLRFICLCNEYFVDQRWQKIGERRV